MKNNLFFIFYILYYYYVNERDANMSLTYYINASGHEDELLMFQGRQIFIKQMEILKNTFFVWLISNQFVIPIWIIDQSSIGNT